MWIRCCMMSIAIKHTPAIASTSSSAPSSSKSSNRISTYFIISKNIPVFFKNHIIISISISYINFDQLLHQRCQSSFTQDWGIWKCTEKIFHSVFVEIGLFGDIGIGLFKTIQTHFTTKRGYFQYGMNCAMNQIQKLCSQSRSYEWSTQRNSIRIESSPPIGIGEGARAINSR